MDAMDRVPTSLRGLEFFEFYIEQIKKRVSRNSVKDCAHDLGIKLSVIDELLSKTEDFKKKFLTEFGQKTEQTGQKSG
jgi:hypothetical protein